MDLAPARLAIAGGLGFSLLRAALQWVAPVPLKMVFDNVLGHHRLPQALSWLPTDRHSLLYVLCAAMAVTALLLALASYGANALLANAGQQVVFDLRNRLFRHMQAQSSAFHLRRPVGDLLARLGGDVQAMQSVVVNVVPVVVENSVTIVGMVVIMFVLDWRFSALALLLLPALAWVVRHYMAAIKASQRSARRHEGLASASAQRALASVQVVQAFGAEEAEAGRYADLAMRGLSANRRSVVLQSRFTPLVNLGMTAAIALVVLVGAQEVLSGRLTPGDLLVFSAYFRGMYAPVRQLAKLAGTVGKGQAAAERVNEILSAKEHLPESPRAHRPAQVTGSLVFDDVSFAYPDMGFGLEHVDVHVEPGQTHALVGSTGSGKSTLLRLVARYADPTRGRVLLDGHDLRDLNLAWLRSQMALVPQEMALLRPTVWENIAYGREGASRADAIAAAKAAGVHDVLAGLRNGYDTEVGEGARALSGGQRQCVAIARAMVRDAPLLLLDEPTTGLDPTTESVVLEGLDRLRAGRTTLLVSHQLSAVHGADRITVLSEGHVVEQGSHEQLLNGGRTYADLHRSYGTLLSSDLSTT
jgi:ATP-binding cassette subfamily B protein/subfamily B ATP-binding cassette protein MsbA